MTKVIIFVLLLATTVGLVFGNTIIGLKCIDGIVIGCDHFPSSYTSGQGHFIQTTNSKSIFQLSQNVMVGCLSGLKEFQKLYDDLRKFVLDSYSSEAEVSSTEAPQCDIECLRRYARHLIYQKYTNVHLMIAGYSTAQSGDCKGDNEDDVEYSLSEILPGGTCIPSVDYIIGGSGGSMLTAALDNFCCDGKTPGSSRTVKQGVKLVNDLLRTASSIDHYSGGLKSLIWVLSSQDAESVSGAMKEGEAVEEEFV